MQIRPATTTLPSSLSTPSLHDLNPGHTCVKVPDPPERITAGTNATLQIIYEADWDAYQNQTFYACADITYMQIPIANLTRKYTHCFNATAPGEDDLKAQAAAGGSKASSTSENTGNSGSPSGSKMSAGAIAGIVIGALAGVCLLASGWWMIRRRRQQRRLRLARMEENARADQFHMQKYSTSGHSS